MNVDTRNATPPHSIEAEQSVLGGLLLKNDAIDRIVFLTGEHFYRHDHRVIFGAICKLIAAKRPADAITVYEALGVTAHEVGGLNYLNSIAQNTPSAANIARYAEIVRDRALLRGLMSASSEIAGMAANPNGREAKDVVSDAQAMLEPLSAAREADGKECGELLNELVDEIDKQHSGLAEVDVTPTGLRDLDDKLDGGMRGGQLIVLAARPSLGKTALALAIGGTVADDGGVVAVFSLEMPAKQLNFRNVARVGKLPLSHVKNGKLMTDDDWPKFTHAVQRMSEWNMTVYDKGGQTAAEIVAHCRALKRKKGRLDLVVLDYLQLMTGGPDERNDLRIGSYSSAMKNLAKELDVPVIVLSQLNRKVEERPNKRPMMSDLKESGAIEADADVILFLHREEKYDPNTIRKGIADIIIGKQRDGETGDVPVQFDGSTQRFDDMPHGYVLHATKSSESQPRRGGFKL